MMERACVITQCNCSLVFWNILLRAERRRISMIIPTGNSFISHVKSDGDYTGVFWKIMEGTEGSNQQI